MMSLLTQFGQAAPATAEPTSSPLVAICLEGDGLLFLEKQLQLDIAAKAFGWKPSKWTLLDLIHIDRIIQPFANEGVANVVLPLDDVTLLSRYVLDQWKNAWEMDDKRLDRAYSEMLDELIQPTQITFSLWKL